ncbi:MAG: elongation factor P [Phycisphaerales bacterium]|nr:elongation factor P [Phycisphaerales bacterium]
MAAMKASELKKGKVIQYEGALYSIFDIERVSKGNWRSYLQIKLKSIKDGRVIDARFGVDDRVETAFVDTRVYQYLYRDGDSFVVMDEKTYDQINIASELIGEGALYLRGNEQLTVQFIDGKIVGVELPNVVELTITDTPPVVRGATATNQTKEAVLETGLRVRVPPFIENGETIRVDTRSGEYLERAKG